METEIKIVHSLQETVSKLLNRTKPDLGEKLRIEDR